MSVPSWARELDERLKRTSGSVERQMVCMRRLQQAEANKLNVPFEGRRRMCEIMTLEILTESPTVHELEKRYKSMEWLAAHLVTPFPFKRHFLEPDSMFERLCTVDRIVIDQPFELVAPPIHKRTEFLSDLRFNNVWTLIDVLTEDYDAMDSLADYFSEPARMQARRRDQPQSPLTLWENDEWRRASLYHELIEADPQTVINHRWLRDVVWSSVKECTQFRPSAAVSLIRHVKAKSVLDFSAGWGDRLLGALAAGVDSYLGIDPNPALVEPHAEMIARYKRPGCNARVISQPAETVGLAGIEPVDLIYTSPPFFDFEIYTDAAGQSIQGRGTVETWLTDFLFVCLRRFWSKLRVHGYLALHLNDARGMRLCEPTALFILGRLENARFAGVIGSKGGASGAVRPTWMFQRMPSPVHVCPTEAQLARSVVMVSLVPMRTWHRADVARVVQDPGVMRWVGGVGAWTDERLDHTLDMCEQDLRDVHRTYFYWVIQWNGSIVGVVCIHPVKYDRGTFLSIMLRPDVQGQGVGAAACRCALSLYRQMRNDMILADVHQGNTLSEGMLRNVGFIKDRTPVTINRTRCHRWRYE